MYDLSKEEFKKYKKEFNKTYTGKQLKLCEAITAIVWGWFIGGCMIFGRGESLDLEGIGILILACFSGLFSLFYGSFYFSELRRYVENKKKIKTISLKYAEFFVYFLKFYRK